MSQSNLEIVKSAYEAFSRGDLSGVLAPLDPQLVWNEAENFMYSDGNPYRGPKAVEQLLVRVVGDWDNLGITVKEFLDAGDTIIVIGRLSGTFKKTGKAMNAQMADVWKLRDGQVVSFQNYLDTAQIRDATEAS